MGGFSFVAGSLWLGGLSLDSNWKCQNFYPKFEPNLRHFTTLPPMFLQAKHVLPTSQARTLGMLTQNALRSQVVFHLEDVFPSISMRGELPFNGQVLEWPAWLRLGAPCYWVIEKMEQMGKKCRVNVY